MKTKIITSKENWKEYVLAIARMVLQYQVPGCRNFVKADVYWDLENDLSNNSHYKSPYNIFKDMQRKIVNDKHIDPGWRSCYEALQGVAKTLWQFKVLER